MSRPSRAAVAVAAVAVAALVPAAVRAENGAPTCSHEPLVVERAYEPDDARTYDYIEFTVPPGIKRVEVGYSWVDHAEEAGMPSTPANRLVQTVFDLGLWQGTIADDAGFRGWSGSR